HELPNHSKLLIWEGVCRLAENWNMPMKKLWKALLNQENNRSDVLRLAAKNAVYDCCANRLKNLMASSSGFWLLRMPFKQASFSIATSVVQIPSSMTMSAARIRLSAR